MRTVLTIAGSDSGGGAGIQGDLKTFAAHGVYGMSAITAVTAQNTAGLMAVAVLDADFVTAQIEAVASDIAIHATKTGMLANVAIVEAVAAAIQDLDLPLVVVDPVMIAKSGDRLLDPDAIDMIRRELVPRALLVTPNIPEAEVLTGVAIHSIADAREAARLIREMGATSVIIKGGHAPGHELIDLLLEGDRFVEFRTPRIETRHTHGTGCAFASAIAANLALGHNVAESAARAQRYVAGAIRHGLPIGHGHGPLNHFWRPEHVEL